MTVQSQISNKIIIKKVLYISRKNRKQYKCGICFLGVIIFLKECSIILIMLIFLNKCVVRIIKLLKLLEEIEQWRLVVLALKRMITPFLALFIVQLGIVYTYAIFGERIYGGQISTNIIRKMSNANFGKEFLSMNFNGLLISMATLFYFSLAWPQLIKLFLIAVPGFISYAYTFSYFVFSFLCLWRIMIFVAIEVYVTIKTLHTSNIEELKAHRKILQKDDGGLLVQDLAASKIIKKYKLLEFEEQKSISKKFNSPKVKSNRTLLEDQTYKSAGRRTEL